jgi:hypothetical protein
MIYPEVSFKLSKNNCQEFLTSIASQGTDVKILATHTFKNGFDAPSKWEFVAKLEFVDENAFLAFSNYSSLKIELSEEAGGNY